MNELRDMIREILRDELLALRQERPPTRVETVRVMSDQDINAFARALLARDDRAQCLADLESGALQFRLEGSAPPFSEGDAGSLQAPANFSHALPLVPQFAPPIITSDYEPPRMVRKSSQPVVAAQSLASSPVLDKILITERDLEGLKAKTRLRIKKGAVLTPLAKDEIRRKGIEIERITL